ncbi:TPA: glycosyltransferase [Proteus mirabilis]
MKISIIICCYNSETRIKNTLKALYSCIDNYAYECEVIIVDNNSTDKTREIALEYWENINKNNYRMNVFFESTPGLSYARYCGAINSNYDLLLFCDDDNWLQETYFHSIPEHFKNKNIGALGGRGIPFSDKPIPDWFFEHMDAYACSTQKKGMLYGASLVIRKDILMSFYSSDLSKSIIGRTAEKLDSGEDNFLCEYIISSGYSLESNNIPFIHFMSSARLTPEYLYKLSYSFGQATYKIKSQNKGKYFHAIYIALTIIKEIYLSFFCCKYKKIRLKRGISFIKGYFTSWIN